MSFCYEANVVGVLAFVRSADVLDDATDTVQDRPSRPVRGRVREHQADRHEEGRYDRDRPPIPHEGVLPFL